MNIHQDLHETPAAATPTVPEKGWIVKLDKRQKKPISAENKCTLKTIAPKPEKATTEKIDVTSIK